MNFICFYIIILIKEKGRWRILKLKEEIEKYIPYNEQEISDKELMLEYINTFDDVLTRANKIVTLWIKYNKINQNYSGWFFYTLGNSSLKMVDLT